LKQDALHPGRMELAAARRESRPLFWAAFVFSIFVNLLMLTGPLYMLQVYDRVLGSRSEETLIALSILVAFLYGMMGLLDYARGRVLARIGARFQDKLDRRVFTAMLRKSNLAPGASDTKTGLRDLESVQTLLSSPALLALFDMPWTPIFLGAIFIFHPWLGYLALLGGTLLVLLTRNGHWPMGAYSAGTDRLAEPDGPAVRGRRNTEPDPAAQTGRQACGRTGHHHSARRETGHLADAVIRPETRSGFGRHWPVWCREIDAGQGADRGMAHGWRENSLGWRGN